MITSKLTTKAQTTLPQPVRAAKAQTTIPQPVRAALKLREGDELVYEIEAGRVILTKAGQGASDDPFRTFDEWDSDADRKSYGKL